MCCDVMLLLLCMCIYISIYIYGKNKFKAYFGHFNPIKQEGKKRLKPRNTPVSFLSGVPAVLNLTFNLDVLNYVH